MRGILASLWFAVFSALQNFRRNLGLSLTGVVTIGLILAAMGCGLVATHLVGNLLQQQQQSASNLKIYLQDSVSEASIANMADELKHDPRVLSVSFTNKDQALKSAERTGIVDPNAIRALGGVNPLPASLNITVHKLTQLTQINNQEKANPLVDTNTNFSTDYNGTVTKTLENINNYVFWIAFGGIVIFGFISLVIIMNTIRTAVFSRRTEIEIMKLVGATNWFVRWPFILEGMLGGLLAAAVSGSIVYLGYRLVVHFLQHSILAVSYDAGFVVVMILFLGAVGAALGALGSYLGVRRFLSV